MQRYRLECSGGTERPHKVRQLAVLRDAARDSTAEEEAVALLARYGFDDLEATDHGDGVEAAGREVRVDFATGRVRVRERDRGTRVLDTAGGRVWVFTCPSCPPGRGPRAFSAAGLRAVVERLDAVGADVWDVARGPVNARAR